MIHVKSAVSDPTGSFGGVWDTGLMASNRHQVFGGDLTITGLPNLASEMKVILDIIFQ